jgi:multidrug efflux pump
VIAVGLVLSAVFIPCAFLTGIVGEFFRQFALTIAVSTIISTFNSLTLSPALAALLLRPRDAKRDPLTWLLDFILGWLFRSFNWSFRLSTGFYTRMVGRLLRVPALVLCVYGGLVLLTWWGIGQLPTGFIPTQDKGYLVASIQLPDSSSVLRTKEVIARIENICLNTPGVNGIKNVNSVAGNSFMLSAYGSNFGSMFVILKPLPLDMTSRVGLSRLYRTRRLAGLAPGALPEDHFLKRGPALVQSFIDTALHPSKWRVLSLFGEPLYSTVRGFHFFQHRQIKTRWL